MPSAGQTSSQRSLQTFQPETVDCQNMSEHVRTVVPNVLLHRSGATRQHETTIYKKVETVPEKVRYGETVHGTSSLWSAGFSATI